MICKKPLKQQATGMAKPFEEEVRARSPELNPQTEPRHKAGCWGRERKGQ